MLERALVILLKQEKYLICKSYQPRRDLLAADSLEKSKRNAAGHRIQSKTTEARLRGLGVPRSSAL